MSSKHFYHVQASADYVKISRWSELFVDFAIPAIAGGYAAYCVLMTSPKQNTVYDWMSAIVTACSILIGFNITAIVVLMTSEDSTVVKRLKTIKGQDRLLNKQSLLLYQLLLISMTHSIVVQLTLIGVDLVSYLFYNRSEDLPASEQWLVYVNFVLLIHLLLVNSRNVTNVYLSVLHPDPQKESFTKEALRKT